MAALAPRINTAMASVKNCFEMARSVEPKPNQSNEIRKLHYDALKEHNDLEKMQKEVDKEEEAFCHSIASLNSDKAESLPSQEPQILRELNEEETNQSSSRLQK